MMERREIASDIKMSFDGSALLNISQVAKYLGVCRDTARAFLMGIEYCPVGNEKKYLVSDIAKKIYESRQVCD